MPIHDWTRVPAGTWHDHHLAWIAALRNDLNGGRLPEGYYVQAEQVAGPMEPDVLALETGAGPHGHVNGSNGVGSNGGDPPSAAPPVAVATKAAAPRTRIRAQLDLDAYAAKRRVLVIRHSSDDRIVALIELVSPGNKSSAARFRQFLDKVREAVERGFHLLVVDLFPPTRRDPRGVHGAIWEELGDDGFRPPAGEPLTLAAYAAGPTTTAWVEPTAVGRAMIDMPLFLTPEEHVEVPLEATYQTAYRGVPQRWRAVLEAPS